MGERIALLFPGQGSQAVGMGGDLAERFPEARAVFQEADEALGFSLSTLMWDGPADELTLTVNAQPALLTHSAAVWAVLRAADIDVVAAGGHSLGEFSAYHAAGSMGFADAVRPVRRRGELMLESGNARPGTMAAVLGLDDDVVEGVCREASADDSVVVPANFNSPGQGSQFVGMGKDLADAFPEARETFQEADEVLGTSLSRLCWEGPEDELTLTVNAQPAILVHSAAVWRVLARRRPEAEIAAGHSLGEFTAYHAAGSLSFADAVRTVRRRGELMFRSGTERPGTMAAVLGLDDAAAEAVCEAATDAGEGVVVAANYNAPGQIVVSGDVEAVRRVEELAREAGAKRVIPLNVSGAFHSPLMAVAERGLGEQLDAVALAAPAFPVVSNVTARPVTDPGEARDLLVRQLTSPVRWVASEQAVLAAGVAELLEIGPGNVLAGLLRRVDRGASVRSLGTVADVESYLREEG